jgi:hypothetical protein
MSVLTRPQKITFGEMRSTGVRGILVYCADFKCSHSIAISADQWPDDVRLSDLEARFVCAACRQERRRRTAALQLEQAAGRDDGLSLIPWRYACSLSLGEGANLLFNATRDLKHSDDREH